MEKLPILRLQGLPPKLVATEGSDILVAWLNLCMDLEAAAGSENTLEPKWRSLRRLLQYFTAAIAPDRLHN